MRSFASCALLGVLLVPASSWAAEAPVFALKPVGHQDRGWFRFDAAPGGTVTGQVRVVNAGKAPGTAELAVVDATTGATTGAVYQGVEAPAEDVGAWAVVDETRVELGPGESRIVGFSVVVPADARRGEHLGGIVARPVIAAAERAEQSEDKSFRVDVVDQSIVALQVDLPGEARSLLAVRGIQASGGSGYQTLLIALSNPGEAMARGRGTLIVRDGAGAEVQRRDFAIDTFLPRTRIDYPVVMRGKALRPGDYRAEVLLRWNGGQRSSDELAFAVSRRNIEQAYGSEGLATLDGEAGSGGGGVPIALIGGGLLIVLLGLGRLGWSLRRRTRELERRLAAAEAPLDPEGEIRAGDARERPVARR